MKHRLLLIGLVLPLLASCQLLEKESPTKSPDVKIEQTEKDKSKEEKDKQGKKEKTAEEKKNRPSDKENKKVENIVKSLKKNNKNSEKEEGKVTETEPQKVLWSEDKKRQLDEYMTSHLSECRIGSESNQLNFYGLVAPAELITPGNMTPTYQPNEAVLTFDWAKGDFTGEAYHIVGCYQASLEANTIFSILYVFAIKDGQPVALECTQNQGGQPNNALYFNDVKDAQFSQFFTNLVNK